MNKYLQILCLTMILSAALSSLFAAVFTNPIARGADPWVVADPNGAGYYYCYAMTQGVGVEKIDSPHMLTGNGVRVYTAPKDTMYSNEYWASELHYLRGDWYIYVAADRQENSTHRMYVLKGTSQDPTKPFEMVGLISDRTNMWAIDGGVLQYKGELYFIWSGAENKEGRDSQNIYIAHMSSPTKIDGEKVMLSKPEYDWELPTAPFVPLINEGPTALYKGDTVHIVYSAAFSQMDDYCLGLLTFRGGDILNPKCWKKSTKPVFSSAKGTYGPGHCSFVKTPDGRDWIVYHATRVSSAGWGGREVRIQPFTWLGDMPSFGVPQAPGVELTINYK